METIRLDKDTLKAILIALIPDPDADCIKQVSESERLVNPHNDYYKPKRRSFLEISLDRREELANYILTRAGY